MLLHFLRAIAIAGVVIISACSTNGSNQIPAVAHANAVGTERLPANLRAFAATGAAAQPSATPQEQHAAIRR